MSTLDSNGISIDRLPEILTNIEIDERSLIDPNLSFAPDAVISHINNIVASSFTSLNQLSQAVYDSFIITKAEGINLDNLATLRGVTRISASKSNTDSQQFTGNNGTTVAGNSIFANPITGDQFTNPVEISVDSSGCMSAELEVVQLLDNEDYEITVNSTVYTYTSDGDATANEIVTAFQSQINGDANATWSATLDGDILIISSDDQNSLSIVTITYIAINVVTVLGYIEATEVGAVVAPPNSITQVVTVVPGLTSTTNLEQLVIGREEETDEQLRLRIANTASSTAGGTIPSIESAILNNVAGVTSAEITENVLNDNLFNISSVVGVFVEGEQITGGTSGAIGFINEVTDAENIIVDVDGINFTISETITGVSSGATATLDRDFPPHAYETVVVGGDNTAVAEELWRTKPAGVRTYGNTTEVIVDSNGNNRTISFTRATAINFAVQVTYSLYDEESFPVNGESLMTDAVVSSINALSIGVDVIPGRLFGPIYSSTSGVEDLTVEIQEIANPGDAPLGGSWQTTAIAVDNNELANITNVDVYFVLV